MFNTVICKTFYRHHNKTVKKKEVKRPWVRVFKYLFNGPFNGPWAGAIHSFPGIPPIYRYVTHFPITIKRGFKESSGQRVFKYLFGEGVGRVRGWDSRGHQYPKNIQCQGSPEKNSAEYPLPPENIKFSGRVSKRQEQCLNQKYTYIV